MSIPPVIFIEGDIAFTGYKEDHRSKNNKTTLKDKLGAFMVTRDFSKVKVDKDEMSNVGDAYLMLALDGQEKVPCHSCGYPTMTALAPEHFISKFDRKYT